MLIALSGCTPVQMAQAGCTGTQNAVHATTTQSSGARVVHAKVTFKCTGVSLTSHGMSSQLQRLVGGSWVYVTSQKNESRYALGSGETATFYTPSAQCVKGKYRYWAILKGTGNGISHTTAKKWSATWTVSTC
jgi:hypothetical protein